MKKFPVIIDLETKHSFREFSDPKKLEISVAVIYDYRDNKLSSFFENNIHKLFPILENSSYIIGYNIRHFDIPVLSAYYPGDTTLLSLFDILEDIKNKTGKRYSLNDVVNATLGERKSGHGLRAIELFKQGKLEELRKYCEDDVVLTKKLFEYGVNNNQIFYLDEYGKKAIKVDWGKYLEDNKNDTPLTLPF